jgi:hypothetical protein
MMTRRRAMTAGTQRCMVPTDPATRSSCPKSKKMISAHSARETRAQDKGGSKKKGKKEKGRGGQTEAAPRACKDQQVIWRPNAARYITAPRCWAFGVHVRVRKAPL